MQGYEQAGSGVIPGYATLFAGAGVAQSFEARRSRERGNPAPKKMNEGVKRSQEKNVVRRCRYSGAVSESGGEEAAVITGQVTCTYGVPYPVEVVPHYVIAFPSFLTLGLGACMINEQ